MSENTLVTTNTELWAEIVRSKLLEEEEEKKKNVNNPLKPRVILQLSLIVTFLPILATRPADHVNTEAGSFRLGTRVLFQTIVGFFCCWTDWL